MLDLNLLKYSFHICMYYKWLLSFSSSSFLLLSVNSLCSDQSSVWLLFSRLIGAQVQLPELPGYRCLPGGRAEQSSAHAPKVEKQAATSSQHALPLPVVLQPQGKRIHSTILAPFQPSDSRDEARLDTLINLYLPPVVPNLCRPHSSLDLPLFCPASGLCPQVPWR